MSDLSTVKDKVVVVTGGAGLLGRRFVEAIVDNGGIGIIADVNWKKAKVVEAEIRARYGTENVVAVRMDITSKRSVLQTIKLVSGTLGRIDALVNNAYPRKELQGKKFEQVSYEGFCEVISRHVGGYFLTTQQFFRFFKKQGHGNIINISSVYGFIPPRFEIFEGTKMTMPVEYAASKPSIIHLTRYFAKYFKGTSIRVNCISPGGVFDDQPDAFVKAYKSKSLSKGLLAPTDVNGALLFLLSDHSKVINGQNIVVDDGYSL